MLAQCDLIAFLATVSPEGARAFYRDALGLELVDESSYGLVFDAGGRMLRVQIVAAFQPHPHTALGWRVADIVAAMAHLTKHSVRFEFYAGLPQDAEGVWITPEGVRIAWFKDPDGNVLSLTQFG